MRLPVLLPSRAGRARARARLGGSAACDSFEFGGTKHATLTYTDDARASYVEATGSFNGREWEDARALFGEIKKIFPYTTYARLSELSGWPTSTSSRRSSPRPSPGTASSSRTTGATRTSSTRATGSRGRLFKDIDDTIFLPPQEERDQATTLRGVQGGSRSYLKDYPTTRFPREERYMYDVVVGRLVRHELYVARFYLRADNFPAAVDRIDHALKAFPGSNLEPEALVLKGETLMKMKKLEDAREVFETVRREYGGPFLPSPRASSSTR